MRESRPKVAKNLGGRLRIIGKRMSLKKGQSIDFEDDIEIMELPMTKRLRQRKAKSGSND